MSTLERIQIFANGLSAGGGAAVVRGTLLAVMGLALILGWTGARFRGFAEPLPMELAESARHIAAGRGPVTGVIRPFDRAWLEARGHLRPDGLLPQTRHAPLYPRVLALVVGRGGGPAVMPARHPAETRILVLGSLLTLLAGLFVGLAARTLYGAGTGWVAGSLYIVSHGVLAQVTAGHQAPLAALLTAAACWLLALAAERVTAGRPLSMTALLMAAAGVLAGLSIATAYTMLVAAAALTMFAALECRTARAAGLPLFLVGLAAVVIPLLAFNTVRTGAPFGTAPFNMLNETFRFPGHSLEAALDSDFSTVGLIPAVRMKLAAGVHDLLAGGLWAHGGILLAVFLSTLFVRSERIGAQSFKLAGLAGLGGMLVAAALQHGTPAAGLGLASFLPVLAISGAGGITELIDREDWFVPNGESLARLLLIALAALPALTALLTPARYPWPPYYPPLLAEVGRLVPSDEVAVSDMPWALAWYGDRRAILLPERIEALTPLREMLPGLRTVHVSTVTGDRAFLSELSQGRHADWLPLLQGYVPDDFPFTNAVALPPGRMDHWLLTDRRLGVAAP